MLNFQSMITILKDKGEMETRGGSPLRQYVSTPLVRGIYFTPPANNCPQPNRWCQLEALLCTNLYLLQNMWLELLDQLL